MAYRLIPVSALLPLLFVMAPGLVCAELADPTRPPVGFLTQEGSAEASTGPVLQSVLIPRKGKALAVIGGQHVRLGEMYGESRLIKLSEREAVLEGPSSVERLLLTPGIEKTTSVMKKINKKPAPQRAQSEGNP